MVGACGWRERRGLAAGAPRHSGPARLAAAANIAAESETSLFRGFRIFFGYFGYFFISSYHMAYMSYIVCRMGIYGRQNTVCRNPE